MRDYIEHIKWNTLLIIGFTAVGSVSGFFLRALLARSLSVAEFGLFYAVFAFVSLTQAFNNLGIGSAITKFIPEWNIDRKFSRISDGFWYLLLTMLAYGILTVFAVFALKDILLTRYFSEQAAWPILVILLIMVLIWSIASATRFIFTSFQRMGWASSVHNLRMALTLAFAAILLRLWNDPLAAAWAYLLSAIVLAIVFTLALRFKIFPSLSLPRNLNWSGFHELFSYGKFFVVISIGGVLLNQTDSVMLTYFSGVEAVGLYNVALPLAHILIYVGSLLTSYMMPMTAELIAAGRENTLRQGLRLLYKFYFLLTIPVVMVFIAFPVEILGLIFGTGYGGAAMALRILSAGTLLFVLSNVNFGVMSGAGQAKEQSHIMIGISVFNVLLNLALIPFWGISGAATATAISYGLAFIISTYLVGQDHGVQIPYWRWLQTLLIAAVSVVAVNVGRVYLPMNNLFEMAILVVLLGAIYTALSLMLRVTTVKEIKETVLLFWNTKKSA